MSGDPAHAIDYIQRATDENLHPYLEKFKPTTWSVAKTEATDFSQNHSFGSIMTAIETSK